MKDDTTPATKGDLHKLEQRLESLEAKVESSKDEILRHFDVMVETIRHDLEGANRDQIEVLKDARLDHERRLLRLERSAGLVAR